MRGNKTRIFKIFNSLVNYSRRISRLRWSRRNRITKIDRTTLIIIGTIIIIIITIITMKEVIEHHNRKS